MSGELRRDVCVADTDEDTSLQVSTADPVTTGDRLSAWTHHGGPVTGALDQEFWRRWALPTETALVLGVMALTAWTLGTHPVLGLFVVVVTVAVNHAYGRQRVRPGLPRTSRVLRDMTIPFAVAGIGVVVGWLDGEQLSAALALSVAGGAVVVAGAGFRAMVPVRKRIVLVGSVGDVAETLAHYDGNPRAVVVGSLLTGEERWHLGGDGPEVAPVEMDGGLAAALAGHDPDMVVVIPGGPSEEQVRAIGWALEGTDTALVIETGLDGIAPHRIRPTMFGGHHILHVRSSRPTLTSRVAKSVLDRVGGAVLLVALAPVLLVLAVAVRVCSPGPALFRQVRVGRNGRPFTMFKFRSMVCTAEQDRQALLDANEGNGLLFKQEHDPRVTPLGRVIRRYSLDELPQLFNVVRGEMSLVGPRPALPEEVARYTPMERRRLAARPGMTGAWQVGGRSTLDRHRSMRLDVDYVDNYRVSDDARILVRTVDAVLRPTGAW